MNQPDLAIVHQPCMDGDGCRWVLEQKWPALAIHPGVYQQDPPDVTDLGILIADFSYPEDVLREMAAKAKWIHVLDHHHGAEAHLRQLAHEGVIKLTFDNDRSGAALTWDYCWGEGRARPKLIEHIQDRDLWKFELEGTREVHAVLSSYDYDRELWNSLSARLEAAHTAKALMDEGRAILRSRTRDMQAIAGSGARLMVIDGFDVPVVNAPGIYASEIGNWLSEGYPFAAVWYEDEDGARKVSLRSQPDGEDVSVIAKKFGGGGHKNAAGFLIPNDGNAEFAPTPEPRKGK